ncbi:hypothetical protein GCM10009764_60110 [Nocardia ninae]
MLHHVKSDGSPGIWGNTQIPVGLGLAHPSGNLTRRGLIVMGLNVTNAFTVGRRAVRDIDAPARVAAWAFLPQLSKDRVSF